MPVKDTAPELLRAAVRSVFDQDVSCPVEIVVWNDGSRDPRTLSMLKELREWSTVRCRTVVRGTRANRGISRARNRACRTARGDWLIWLDSDDELPPGALQALLGAAGPQTLLVAGQCAVVTDGRTTIHRNDLFLLAWQRDRGTPSDPLLDSVFAVHGALVHRRLFAATRGFDPAFGHGELTDWFLRALATLQPSQISVAARETYRYVKRHTSHSADREVMEYRRRAALERYAHLTTRTPPVGFRLAGHCEVTGARRYERFTDNGTRLPVDVRPVDGPGTIRMAAVSPARPVAGTPRPWLIRRLCRLWPAAATSLSSVRWRRPHVPRRPTASPRTGRPTA